MSKRAIKKVVKEAWSNRKKIETQHEELAGDRIKYRGRAENYLYEIKMW